MKTEKNKSYDVVIIGGGAAGIMAAITAARCGVRTAIIEHKDRIGKKILSTGNGKCNYTNALQGIAYYRGDNPAFVLRVFEQFGLEDTLKFFEEIGVYPKCRNGYYYPASEQAAALLEVLRMELEYRRVDVLTECELKHLNRKNNSILLDTNLGKIVTKKVILATGLLAAPKTGSDGSSFPYIEKLGHHFTDIVPALVALQGKQSFFKAIAGIRAEIQLEIYINQKNIAMESGELQLTDYGISGIPVFQISRFATKALARKEKVYVLLDFMPKLSTKELTSLLEKRFYQYGNGKTASEALIGLVNKKLGDVLLKEAGISLQAPAKKTAKEQLEKLVRQIKALRVDVIGSKTFEQAQVCAGGVDTREVNNETLESYLAPNFYFAGELLDIDGICGGYNLQWAWSSGYVAGLHAAKACRE